MRELAMAGLIAFLFGLGSVYATGEFGIYGAVNLGLGALALLVAAAGGARRMRGFGASAARGVLLRRAAVIAATVLAAVALERGAQLSQLRLDWTTDGRFELAQATRDALQRLPGPLRATLYYEPFDARGRRTRYLLGSLAEAGPVTVQERALGQAPAEEERFGITNANSVVLEVGNQFERVDRPTEGSLLEGMLRLLQPRGRTLYVALGEGEGDLGSGAPAGFSGLRSALETEGYRLRGLVSAARTDIPDDAAAVLVVRPQRAMRPEAIEALGAYLGRGGSLVALLDPGTRSGLEELLLRFGFELPDAVVVDLASGPLEGSTAGINPLVSSYADHPVTRGLHKGTMTFFHQARPVLAVRKPTQQDRLGAVAFSSGRAWAATDVTAVSRGLAPERPKDVSLTRLSLVAAGQYPRAGGEARIVLFGDSDFASNKYLRALYNLDLILNAMHWAVQEESGITLRPKRLTPNQDPLTPGKALGMFYGVGLLMPQLMLIAGAIAWVRRRTG